MSQNFKRGQLGKEQNVNISNFLNTSYNQQHLIDRQLMNRQMLKHKKGSISNIKVDNSLHIYTDKNTPDWKMIASRLPFSTPNLNQEKIIKNIMLNPGTFLHDCKNIQSPQFSGDSFFNHGHPASGYARRKTASGHGRMNNNNVPKSQQFYQ